MDFFKKVKNHVKIANTTIEDFISDVFDGNKDRDSFNGWKRRNVLPRADEAIKIAKAMGTTVEELVDGEDGAEYVRRWVKNEGKIHEPPERIADIVVSILGLSDRELNIVRGTIKGMCGDAVRDDKGDELSPPGTAGERTAV